MMTLRMKLVATLFFLVSFNLHAASGDTSLGGCGLGWKVAPQHSMISITTRGTTNVWTSSFGTTSGTSGCARHGIVMRQKMEEHFSETNMDALLAEIPQGQGERIFCF